MNVFSIFSFFDAIRIIIPPQLPLYQAEEAQPSISPNKLHHNCSHSIVPLCLFRSLLSSDFCCFIWTVRGAYVICISVTKKMVFVFYFLFLFK